MKTSLSDRGIRSVQLPQKLRIFSSLQNPHTPPLIDSISLPSTSHMIMMVMMMMSRLRKLLLLFLIIAASNGDVLTSSSEQLRLPENHLASSSSLSPARRSLLSQPTPATPNAEFVASVEGKLNLLHTDSGKVIWSVDLGAPLYTSYQAPMINADNGNDSDRFYLDVDEDGQVYIHSDTNHYRQKLQMSIADFVNKTPYTLEDGAVTLGSKNTTVMDVDARTGKKIVTYTISDVKDQNKNKKQLVSRTPNAAVPRIQITKTDYSLKSFIPNLNEVSWNLSHSEITATLFCPDIENPLSTFGSESGSVIVFPLSCLSKSRVRHQDRIMSGLTRPKRMLEEKKMPVERKSPSMFVILFDWSTVLAITFTLVFFLGFVAYRYAFVVKGEDILTDQRGNYDSNTPPSKRKKSRRSVRNGVISEKKEKHISSQDEEALAHTEGDNKAWLLDNLFHGAMDGRRIGKLLVSNTEIAKGSNGTIVLEGIYEGRRVAVKRLVLSHHEVAFKEIQNLIASDRHPNIVRWYGVEYDQDFVYLSLERCICNLDDMIQMYSDSSQNPLAGEEHARIATIQNKAWLLSVKNTMPDINLWKENGFLSPLLVKLMRDVVSGLVHLHELGIIHRDLKPQNVLLIKESSLCAKLSDMGISKRLTGDMSSLGPYATGKYSLPGSLQTLNFKRPTFYVQYANLMASLTEILDEFAGCGSSGWQAPEQLLHGRQTRAVDLFSLGCVLFFCITGGKHPFGDRLERDINIVKNQMDLFLVEYIPEALDLISRLLNRDPELRPKALEVLRHPLFWSSEMRLAFLRDISDRVELEDRGANSDLLKTLESTAPVALGGKWNEKMEPAFITNIGHYRRYKFDSVRDLLRVMRNKSNHYRELPNEIQKLLGPVPEGFDGYFASRFPKLLIEVYKVVCRHCKEEEWFQKYLKSTAI